ncbi:hypothetical protein [Nonomuraea cavernae]|uniref:hypothetical protein n=1 Tax=Nonomuraea cavernae TaxID=2045107 RepID=UPI0033CD9713
MTTVTVAVPRTATILRLLIGRGAFRIGVQVTAVALVAVWDGPAFSLYAGAVGQCAWLLLAGDAPEKAALKTLPRTRRLGPAVARLSLAMAAVPTLVLLAALVPVAVFAPLSAATAYLAAGTWSACTGLLMAVSGLHRLRGRPGLDTVAFGATGGVVLAVTAATLLVGWAPQVHLLLLLAGTLVVTAAAVAALPRDWLRRPPGAPRRRLLGKLARLTWLLGVADLCDALCFALVYLVLAVSGLASQSGTLYLALLPAVAVCQVVVYLLRVTQPATSHRLRGVQGRSGRSRARRLLRLGERLGAGFAAVFALLLAVPVTRGHLTAGEPPVLALGLLVGVVLILFLIVMYAGYLVENTNNDVLVVTSSGALVGLVATGLLAAALVPWLGALGALAALALSIPIKAHTMRRMMIFRELERTTCTY